MNLRAILFGLIALAVALPAAAANKGTAEFGIDQTGTCRDVAVRDIVLGGWVPIGCLDTTTHLFVLNSATAFGNQNPNRFLAGPSTDPAGPATWRAIEGIDLESEGGNIKVGSNTLSVVTPNLPDEGDGVNLVAIGPGALQFSETPNLTVGIGANACQNYGKRRTIASSDDTFSEWTLTTGWAAAGGFATHTPGNTGSMTTPVADVIADTPYYLIFTISGRTAGTITPKLSGGGIAVVGQDYSTNTTVTQLFRSNGGNSQVEFLPSSDFDGRISVVALESLGGRASVCLGALAGQYIGNSPSSTFLGAYAGQGAETDPVTGLDISGTDDSSPLSGTDNGCMGEACMLHIRGGASANIGYGFNFLFNLLTGSGNSGGGNAAMSWGTTLSQNTAMGAGAYKFGNGSQNTFSGSSAGLGDNAFTTLEADTEVGDFTFVAADASIFAVGGGVDNGGMFYPGTLVTAIDLGTNTVTVDKAIWKATTGGIGSLIYSIPNPHTGQLNTGDGAFALQDISGAASFNTGIGAQSCKNLTTGSSNICIGRNSGIGLIDGSNNIYIGGSSAPSAADITFEMNIANTIKGTSVGSGVAGFIGIGAAWPTTAFDGTRYRLDVQGYLRASGIFVTESGRVRKVRVVIASGGIAAAKTDDVIAVNKTIAATTNVVLPSSPTTGQTLTVKDAKGDAGTRNITLTPSSGTIDGAATGSISTNYGCAGVIYNGTEWNVIGCAL